MPCIKHPLLPRAPGAPPPRCPECGLLQDGYGTEVDAALDAAAAVLARFTVDDWIRLAVAAADQAGAPLMTQKAITRMLIAATM